MSRDEQTPSFVLEPLSSEAGSSSNSSNLVAATMSSSHGNFDRVLVAADPYIREIGYLWEADGVYVLRNEEDFQAIQDENPNVRVTFRFNKDRVNRMVSYVAEKIHQGLKMSEKAVIGYLQSLPSHTTISPATCRLVTSEECY